MFSVAALSVEGCVRRQFVMLLTELKTTLFKILVVSALVCVCPDCGKLVAGTGIRRHLMHKVF